jgi:hypothetical protein
VGNGKKKDGKPRHLTMQVDVAELYAELEGRGTKPPPLLPGSSPSTAPAAVVMPPAGGLPGEPARTFGTKEYALIVVIALVAAAAAWGLSQVIFGDAEPTPEPAGTMELGPIELSD